MRTVASFVELLALRYRGRLDEDADRYIASVVEGTNRMSRLINDLLDYSRIITREKPFAPVAMKAVVGKVVSLLKAWRRLVVLFLYPAPRLSSKGGPMEPKKNHKPAASKPSVRGPGEPDFKVLFESLPGLYLVLDPELHIVAVSDAYAQATMTKREEILGRPMFQVFPDNPEDPHATGVRNLSASLRRVLRNRNPDIMPLQKYDIRYPKTTGGGFEVRYWSPINSPVFGPDNELAYIIHRVEDVTGFIVQKEKRIEQEKIAEELRQKGERMEAEIYVRNREVAEVNLQLKENNDELARLYEKAKEVDRIKTSFFANVSHELRTPLTLILGPVERWLKSGDIADNMRRGLEVIQRNARLLLRHVNNLLDLAKLEAGRLDLRYTEVDLARLVRFVGLAFESLAEEKEINYTVDVPQSARAQVDLEKIQRILLNLLSNAIKFTPRGGIVSLTLQMPADRVVIEVRDSGPGVPFHLREQIFERFRQGEEGMDRWAEGTGLGLAIVKELTFTHNGTVSIEDAPGGGASFRVSLPRTASAGTPVEPERISLYEEIGDHTVGELIHSARTSAAKVEKPGVTIPLDAPLVLVVEDNPDMTDFEADILGRKYRVLTAADGEEGLRQTLNNRPDLIVTDIMMPRMSGDEMIRKIRRHRELDDTPIIVITARTDEDFMIRLLQEGVQGYLVKPFSAEELMARAEGLMTEKKRKEELRQLVFAISHDLQEPLRTVTSFIELLAQRYKGSFDEAADRYITHAVNGANRMSKMIEDLLTYSRIGTHSKPFEPVSMNDIFAKATGALQSAVEESGAEIIRDDLPMVTGDEGQLVQLLQNLIANAIKYRKPEEPPRIRLSALRQGSEWVFGVHDNGIGIEQRFHKRIFIIFQRLHTREEYPGTGIGLALSLKTIVQHRGRIWVESEPGRGSTFHFSLPARSNYES